MTRSPSPGLRRVATGLAVAGGGVTALGGGLWGLLVAEAKLARRQIGNAEDDPPAPSGWYGHGRPGPAIKIALLGDSSAAGYGVETVEETPGAYLASGVAEAADRRVYLSSVAKVGAQSKDLAGQIDRVLPMEPHVAIIFIGGNDVTHAVPVKTSQRLLRAAVTRLKSHGVKVVVGTCPDLGAIEPLQPPLRQIARVWSRQLAQAQATVVVQADARAVALGSILGEEFTSLSHLLFGPDRFHPSAAGYARMSAAVLPTVLAALDLVPEDETPEWDRGEAVLPIDIAVLEAARHPGASVEPVTDETGRRGPGRFATLRRRRHQPETDVHAPEDTEDGVEPHAESLGT
ncbi:SGNH/GDSL hydrolase family protein [Nocardioides marmoribigeumensis]|uniref:Lysophospholipase L1-like esterase n=1 Tax=Nocardioides marmoribigeumensis TaxID=433649 RepID=A0ABU2BZM8_9ACTN|nr:SGNH/GDSL hydrolase family protein [Nocardioides marmoribigeumensis]MDR7363837.1 lysophospholipase L1-like esterase [Nocardioides marmoribigeumensis]